MFGNDKNRTTAPFKKAEEKIAMALKVAGLSESAVPQSFSTHNKGFAYQNRHMLPLFTKNLKTFCPVI